MMVMLLISSFFIVSCDYVNPDQLDETTIPEEIVEDNLEEAVEEIVEEETLEEEVVEEIIEEDTSCSVSDDCEWNEHCIEGVCGMTSDIYDTEGECDTSCNFNNVIVTTSDGDELTLSRGQGSYTAAGAVEWKLLSSADYCQGEDATPVAIELIKKNLGQILSNEVIVLDLGVESDSIGHPTIASIDFTLEVESYDETCS
ncbi:hypothetical protein CL619_00310 [archaeon]|nr:hypothetical protein [archaeon]